MKDLKPGMELKGTVRNVIDFGAFVDIGVHQDGLVHISQICNRFIKHPSEVLSVGDVVTVWVKEVDKKEADLPDYAEGQAVTGTRYERDGADVPCRRFAQQNLGARRNSVPPRM